MHVNGVKSVESDSELTNEAVAMKGFVQDIDGLAVKNEEFRRMLYTAKYWQLVVMALKPWRGTHGARVFNVVLLCSATPSQCRIG